MENSLIISLIVLFIHMTFWDGEIFEGIKKIIKPRGKIYKAVYGCNVCMCPWYGTIIYLIFFRISISDYLLTIGAACGISVLFVVALTIRTACVNYNKEFEK